MAAVLDDLKRRQTRQLQAIVRRVRSQMRRHRYITFGDKLIASAALTIIKERKRRRGSIHS